MTQSNRAYQMLFTHLGPSDRVTLCLNVAGSQAEMVTGEVVEKTSEGLLLQDGSDMVWISPEQVKTFRIHKSTEASTASVSHQLEGQAESDSASRDSNEVISQDNTPREPAVAPSSPSLEMHFPVAPPNLDMPVPPFPTETGNIDDQQELLKWKNQYDYWWSRKRWKLRDIIPAMARFAERTANVRLFELCGCIARELGDFSFAKSFFRAGLVFGGGDCGVRSAAISLSEQNYEEGAHTLVLAMGAHSASSLDGKLLGDALGYCIKRLKDREVPGLYWALMKLNLEHNYRNHLLALSVENVSTEAANAYRSNEHSRAKLLLAKSRLYWIPKLEPPKRPPPTPMESSTLNLKVGRISAYYNDRQFGFVVSEQRPYFFHETKVRVPELLAELKNGLAGQVVSFKRLPSEAQSAHKYPPAEIVELSRSGTGSINVRRIGDNRRLQGLPKGDSAYRKAKIAEQRGDLEAAQRYFEEEISTEGPYAVSAVKDCAALLSRLEDFESALAFIAKYRHLSKGDNLPLDNLRLHILIKAKSFESALQLARKLEQQERAPQRKRNLAMQSAYILFCLGRRSDCLKALDKLSLTYPRDQTIREMRDKLKQAKLTPGNSQAPFDRELREQFSELTLGQISAFSKAMLSTCEFRGVDERSRARGFYNVEDFNAVSRLLSAIKGRRPKDKAEYLLTLAAIADQSPDVSDDTRDLLQRCFTFQGEAALHDEVHRDVARCYLAEAICLCNQSTLDTAFCYLVASYYSLPISPGELVGPDGRLKPFVALHRLVNDQSGWRKLAEDLPYYAFHSALFVNHLIKELAKIPELNLDPVKIELERQTEKERLREENTRLRTLARIKASASSLIESAQTLKTISEQSRFEVDRQRLSELSTLFRDASLCWTQGDFIEKESRFERLVHGIEHLIKDIREAPTKLSVEAIKEIAESLLAELDQHFEEFKSTSYPSLAVSSLLSDSDYYIPDNDGVLELAIEIRSAPGGAPVEGLEVQIRETGGLKVLEPGHYPGVLRGGERRELRSRIKPTSSQLQDQAFTVFAGASYRTRDGLLCNTEAFQLPVRIGTSENFTPLANPYAPYSGGTVVDEPEMFFGRQELIQRIIEQVCVGPLGQCFVLYGQKRSGKSSVIRQVIHKIALPNLCISFSVGLLQTGNVSAEVGFTQLLVDNLEDRLMDLFGSTPNSWPSTEAIAVAPLDCLRRTLKATIKFLESQGHIKPRIIVLIDEFTYLYEYIQEGIVSDSFMRNWKGLLEQKLFSSVVVGQDSMPKFKRAFPNEFGVTHDERMSYLTPAEARNLSEKPILLNGESRYRGGALARIQELTAGSPFYLQIFCDRLVRHMNARRAPFITEADVEFVAKELVAGQMNLPIERFDPLITAAGESVAEATREKYLEVLSHIAGLSASATQGARKAELLVAVPDAQRLLPDLTEREVIRMDDFERILIQVGLFAEWLRHNNVLV